MSKLVRIFTTRDPNEAEIVKNALQAAGISCFAEGEQQAGFAGVFEINLVVPEDSEMAARQVLDDVA